MKTKCFTYVLIEDSHKPLDIPTTYFTLSHAHR